MLERSAPPRFFSFTFSRVSSPIPTWFVLASVSVQSCHVLSAVASDTIALIFTPSRTGIALVDKGYQCRGEKYGFSTFFSWCLVLEAVQNRFPCRLWRDDKHTKVSAAGRSKKTENARVGGTRHQSSCVYENMCVSECVRVCVCVCVQGRNEGEGGTEIERKKGGREYTWKEEKGRRIFFLFSWSHFL